MNPIDNRIPVSVLTGLLDSGKTTLLNRILSENRGRRIAVLESGWGGIGTDSELVTNADEENVEMNNDCICCTVRGELIRILNSLVVRCRLDRAWKQHEPSCNQIVLTGKNLNRGELEGGFRSCFA